MNITGLNEKESKVYTDLLQYRESQTGNICQRTKIPSSHIYSILTSLLEKGLVNYKLINNIKVFRASEPEALENLFKEKENKLKQEKQQLLKSISELKLIPKEAERFSDFKFYKGIRGIKSLYTEVINSWKKGDEYCIASAPQESFAKLEGFFLDVVHKKRVKDKVKLKMLINKNSKKYAAVRKKMPLTEIKYLEIDTKTEYGILNNYLFLINYGKEPYGLLIKDQNFADSYRIFFNLLWNQAK